MLEDVLYQTFSFADLMEKNAEKIAHPKGKGGSSGGMGMY